MRGSDRTEKHFLHLVWSLKIEYKRLKHEPHGNKSVGANTVRPSKEQAHNYNTVWQPKNLPTAPVGERRNFCFTEMGVPIFLAHWINGDYHNNVTPNNSTSKIPNPRRYLSERDAEGVVPYNYGYCWYAYLFWIHLSPPENLISDLQYPTINCTICSQNHFATW